MPSDSLHEPEAKLSAKTIDMHRAIRSLMEELEAVDWYRQRADATKDEALKAVVLHNAREEIEHACMVLEWLRRNDADFERNLRTYLFSEGDITLVEKQAEGKE
jgi:ferritin-like protein